MQHKAHGAAGKAASLLAYAQRSSSFMQSEPAVLHCHHAGRPAAPQLRHPARQPDARAGTASCGNSALKEHRHPLRRGGWHGQGRHTRPSPSPCQRKAQPCRAACQQLRAELELGRRAPTAMRCGARPAPKNTVCRCRRRPAAMSARRQAIRECVQDGGSPPRAQLSPADPRRNGTRRQRRRARLAEALQGGPSTIRCGCCSAWVWGPDA